jgi:YVTN family beta-propeller protein
LVGSDIQGLALQPDGSLLYVPSIDGESIFIVDPATLEQIDLILTNPIPDFSPFRGTISPDGTRLYVASWTRKPTTVSVIDTSTREVIGDIVAGQDLPCGSESWGLDIAPGGDTLYVLSSNDHCVLIADAQSHQFVDSFDVPLQPGSWLTSIAVHPDGEKVYVLEHAGVVSVFDLETQGLTTTLPLPDQCTLIKLSPDGQRGYVVCQSSFSVLDLASDMVLDTIQIGGGGLHFESLFYAGVKPDSSTYIIGAFFNLYEYDAASNSQMEDIDLDGYDRTWLTLGQDFVFSPDGSLGYLAMPDENAVTVFNTSTWEVVSRIDTGYAPHYGTEPVWLLMAPDGGQLFVLNELSDNVLVIDTTLKQVVEVINLAKCRLYMPLIIRE